MKESQKQGTDYKFNAKDKQKENFIQKSLKCIK